MTDSSIFQIFYTYFFLKDFLNKFKKFSGLKKWVFINDKLTVIAVTPSNL